MDQILAREAGQADAARVARAGDRVGRDGGRVRRRVRVRLHQHDLVAQRRTRRCRWRTTRAWSSSGCSATAAAPTRRRGAPASEQDRSVLDSVIEEAGAPAEARSAPGDRAKLVEYLDAIRDVERRIQKAEEQSGRELPVVDHPAGMPGTLRRAREADVRSAGARLSDRPDARHHVHARPRVQRRHVSADRRARRAPPDHAPSAGAREDREGGEDQRAITSRSSRTCSSGCGPRPTATARCSITRC